MTSIVTVLAKRGKFSCRLAAALAAASVSVLGLGLPHSARADTAPPLNVPATADHIPGKFVWADLFTGDPAAATKFYCGLFGWTSQTFERKERAYTILSNGDRPVAGVVSRSSTKSDRPARWIFYIAVTDIESILAAVKAAHGRVLAPVRQFPKRGTEAIVSDNEGSVVGILQSVSGDPSDDEPNPGDWSWFHLISEKPFATTEFYHQVFSYDVKPDDRMDKKDHFLLSSNGRERASVSPVPDRPDAKSDWMGIIRVANIEDATARVAALGGQVLVPPKTAALGSRFAIVEDPTGGEVGLVEYANDSNPTSQP